MLNNENVLEADINTLRNIISKNDDNLNLVLRRPPKQVLTVKNLNLSQTCKDLGIRLAVSVVADKYSVTQDCVLQDMDELVKASIF